MKGNILIASPNLLFDNFFSKTIIFIVDQTKDGYTGFILNKPLKIKIKEVKNFTIFNGGPVSNENLYFIYKTEQPLKGSLKIKDNIYWGGNIDEIFKLIEEEIIDNNSIRFFIGYSGWDFDQLKNEIENKNWIIGKNNTETILEINNQSHWKGEMKKLGGEYILWSESPENPISN
ncbi:MAG: YqgE/AlgH family protein [Candidatus Marisimplicoccus sp.]